MIRILFYAVGKPPQALEVEPGLDNMQALVGGYIEAVRLSDQVLLYCNEEGRLRDMPPNLMAKAAELVGPVVLCAIDHEGHARSLTDKEVEEFEDLPRLCAVTQ